MRHHHHASSKTETTPPLSFCRERKHEHIIHIKTLKSEDVTFSVK